MRTELIRLSFVGVALAYAAFDWARSLCRTERAPEIVIFALVPLPEDTLDAEYEQLLEEWSE